MEFKKHKKLFIFISIIIVLFLISGSFTIYDNSLTFKYTNTVKPYSPGKYMNYTVCDVKNSGCNNHISGYINVTSFKDYISINTAFKYLCDYYSNGSYAGHSILFFKSKEIKILKKNNDLFFNNTEVNLPFFWSGKTLSHYKSVYENVSCVSPSMISNGGIFKYHAGNYITTADTGHVSSNDEHVVNSSDKNFDKFATYNILGECIYDAHSRLLDEMCGNNVIINYMLGLHVDVNGTYFPLSINMVLNKTNTIVFPLDYVYIAAVYALVAIAPALIIIIPVAAILGIKAYRSHRRKKVKDHGK